MDPTQPQARGMAIRDGKFLAVGTAADMETFRGPETCLIDLGGQIVFPGLGDAHIHFTAYALGLSRIDLFEVPTLAEMLRRLAKKAEVTAPGK